MNNDGNDFGSKANLKDIAHARAYTAIEVREMFLDRVISMIGYWNGEGKSNVDPKLPSRDKMEGLVHSLFVLIDGHSGDMPAFNLVCSPHPEDENYHRKNGENWMPQGAIINDCMLRDEYNARR